jgi:alpha-L-fucosidase 2
MANHGTRHICAGVQALLAIAAMAWPALATGNPPEMKWWYGEPAAKYWEALPLSNGWLAAMVYGRTRDELIPLNDASLWSGGPYDPNNPEGRDALPEIRRLLLAGEYVKAQALCQKLLSPSVKCGCGSKAPTGLRLTGANSIWTRPSRASPIRPEGCVICAKYSPAIRIRSW